MTDHPITPPPEIRRLWAQQAQRMDPHDPVAWLEHVATKAARWGADTELEACIDFVCRVSCCSEKLRAARRPKPPSLAEKSLDLIDKIQSNKKMWQIEELDVVRRAVERLQELEDAND